MGSLDGRVAVITGAGRGIGRAIALRYALEGADVVVSSRTEAELRDVARAARELGVRSHLVVADATDRSDAIRPVQEAIDQFGAVDILVNNVGGTIGRGHDPFALTTDLDGFERTLTLSLTSAWWTSSAALPEMRERGWGRIINIGSGASKMTGGTGGGIAYTTAKHGLVGLTKQLAQLVAELGITVNCLCPGWTNTSLVDWEAIGRARGRTPEEAQTAAARDSAQNRILEPDELAGMATLLASADGRGITGQVISVDGGYRI